jgi:RNA polymerase sigma-70 factor (ECF subfamily)
VDAYSQFYKENKDRLYAYLLRMTEDRQLAIDLVQESFTRYLGRYEKHGNNKSLLYTIARNAALDVLRKQKMSEIDADKCEAPGKTPEQEIIDQEVFKRMLSAMAQLALSDRELISLVATGDLTYQEIGCVLKISESNVKVRVHRARKKLQAILSSGGE